MKFQVLSALRGSYASYAHIIKRPVTQKPHFHNKYYLAALHNVAFCSTKILSGNFARRFFAALITRNYLCELFISCHVGGPTHIKSRNADQ